MTTGSKVFVREATGLVRRYGFMEIFTLNFHAQPILMSIWMAGAIALFAPADPVISMTMLIPWTIAFSLTYYFIVLTMRRSGADYVFTSRSLGAPIGFGFLALGSIVQFMVMVPVWSLATSSMIGVLRSIGLSSAAEVLSVPTTTQILIALFGILGALITISRRWFGPIMAWSQAWGIIGMMLFFGSLIAAAGLFPGVFNANAVNTTYEGLVDYASKQGFAATVQLGPTVIAMAMFFWFFAAQQVAFLGGEIKGGNRTLLAASLGAQIGYLVIYLGSGVLAYFAFGQAQFRALTWLFYNKASAYPLKADPSVASLLTLVFPNQAFAVILNLSMFFSVLGIISFAYTNLTRAWFVASFDRVLPAKLASVDDRFNIPWLTYVIAIVIGMILVAVQFFVPFWTYWYNSSVALGSYWFITALALMLFPFTRKDLMASAPRLVRRWAFPVGLVNAGYILFAILITLVMPEVGGITWVQPATLIGIFLVGVVLYVLIRAYRSREGIDVGLAFRQIPPE